MPGEEKDMPFGADEESAATGENRPQMLNLDRVQSLVEVAAKIIGVLSEETKGGREASFAKGAVDHWQTGSGQ